MNTYWSTSPGVDWGGISHWNLLLPVAAAACYSGMQVLGAPIPMWLVVLLGVAGSCVHDRLLRPVVMTVLRDAKRSRTRPLRARPVTGNTVGVPINQGTRRWLVDEMTLSGVDWSGDMTEPDFLDRLYNLKALPSRDARFTNAQGDISKHQVMNHSALRWRRVSRQLPRICNSTADSSTYPWLWKSGEVARHGALEADDRNTPETRHRSLRTPWNCDINDDIASFLARIAEDVGGLDGLVNNAGITVGGPVELLNEENWRQQSEVNFFGLVTHSMGIAASSRRV